MRALLFIVCLSIVTASFAAEVSTDCVAMNEVTREKVVKTEKPKPRIRGGASSQ